MPISGNEEPGVLSPQLKQQQQFINFSGAIPIKKRKFPVVRSPPPSPEEKTCCSEENVSKDKNDSNSPDGRLSIDNSKYIGHPCKIEENKSFELIVKKEQITDARVELAQDKVDTNSLKPQEANVSIGLGSLDVLKNEQNMMWNEKSVEPESRVGSEILNVKQELVGRKIEGADQLELSTCLDNAGLFLGANKPCIPCLEEKIGEGIGQMSGKSDLSSLSFLVSHDRNNSTISDVSSLACVNRSNWDLNMTMDVWEGSVANQAYVCEAAGIDGSRNSKVGCGVIASFGTSLVVGVNLNEGNQVLDEHSSNSSNTSVQHSQLHLPEDILSLSLSMPCRELDLCGEHSSLSDNMGSESDDSRMNLGLSQPNMNLTFTNVGIVKSEPVNENSNFDCSTGNSSNMVLSKLSSVKKECLEKNSAESVIPKKSVKSELVQEGNKESCESKRSMLSQSVAKKGKVMQHQDSSASSSALLIPLTPQNSCPSSILTCLELPVVGGLLNQLEHSLPSKEVLGPRYIPDEQIDGLVSKSVSQNDKNLNLYKTEELSALDAGNCQLVSVIENSNELCGNNELVADNEEKMKLSTKIPEESTFVSDCKSYGNHISCMDVEEKIHDKEDDDYEDGEVREPLKDSVGEDARVVEPNSEKLVLVECHSKNSHSKNNDQNTSTPVSDKKAPVTKNNDETICNKIKEGAICFDEAKSVDIILQNPLSDNLKDVDSFGKKSVCVVTPEKPLDLLGEDVDKSNEKEISAATSESQSMGATLDGDAIDNTASSEVKVSADGNNIVKDFSRVANKSRIITLPRASIISTPCKTRSLSGRLLTPQSEKDKYYNLDGDARPRWNRDELYTDDPRKCVKDRVHGRSFRNSRHSFMLGKGRVFGRFGRLHNEWDSDRDYEAKTYNGRADYRVLRHKQSSSVAGELEFNDYGITPDGTSCSGMEKTINDELPSVHRPFLRRLPPGDIDGQMTRNTQMPRRFPRNISPSRYTVEDGSDFMGRRHDEKFMSHLSDDIRDPVFPRQHTRFDDLDCQLRRNRNFSAVPRKGYPRTYSKSPVRSRTRSPGPWSSPRQRSPNGHPGSTQQRSPPLFRMGRMTSPGRTSCHDEMGPRRRASPSYISQHMNGLKDFDFGREHVHPRPVNSNRRSPPRRVFHRSTVRSDVLDSRERTEGDEYSNRPGHSDRFQELCNDGSMDERRNLSERRGFVRSSYDTDNGNYHLHLNSGPKPYRLYQEADTEFVERSNMREREFDGHIKHPPLSVSRRMRDIEEQQGGSHRPGGRGWHDDGFSDVSGMKRRRF
ncbi:uncharacterized protein LOC142533829 [Primulina tabacum]|uniref:uncharacterized protein LOC142533829 n=1 Tax=Primulina tabacum TaxID=48773 RepID=UPI003F5A40EA